MAAIDAKRALARLSASFGLAWVAIAMVAAPGPSAWVALSGDDADAGLFFALFGVASALGALLGGRALERWGYRALVAAHLFAGVGSAAAGVAFARGSLVAFAGATSVLGFGVGAIALTRIAAAGLFPAEARGRAVARVAVSATVGAVSGPFVLLALPTLGDALGRPAEGLVWFLMPPLLVVAALLTLSARAPHAAGPRVMPGGSEHAPRAAPDKRIPFHTAAAAVLALVCAQAAMVSVMGVTGVHLSHTQSDLTTSVTMAMHFAGMFALSLLVGRFADARGRRAAILVGTALLAIGGLAVAFVGGAPGLAGGLLLVGLGWSFSYIGGTVLMTDVVPEDRRARFSGSVDFATALLAAAASFAAGHWYAKRGITGLGLAAVALVTIPLLLAFTLRPKPEDAPASAPVASR